VGINESSDRRIRSKSLSVRPVAYATRVAPLEAIAEVVSPRGYSTADHRVSVRVEVVAAGAGVAGSKPAAAAGPATPILEALAGSREFEAVQRMAASTAAALGQSRGPIAYAAAARIFEVDVLSRGVCVRVLA
jgi:hypothetical protein